MQLFRNPINALTEDPQERRNLWLLGLSTVAITLSTPFLNGVNTAFNAQVGLTPPMLAAMMLPQRILIIVMILTSTAFIDRVRNRILFNAALTAASAITGVASLIKCLGPDCFRQVTGLVILEVIFSIPLAIITALRGGADATVQCRVLHNEIRGRFWSMFGIVGGLGGLLVGIVITFFLKRYNVFISMVLSTIPGMVLAVVSGWLANMVRELPDLKNETPPKKEPIMQSLLNVVKMKQFRIMMPANFLRNMGDGAVGYALLLAMQNWGVPQEYAGYSQMTSGIAPFLGYIILWLTLDRFGAGIVLPVTDAIIAVSMVCMVAIPNGNVLIGCLLVYNTLIITESAAIPLAHYEVVPNEVIGAFSNVRLMLMYLSGFISGTAVGFLLAKFSPLTVFAGCALIKLSAGLLFSYGVFTLRKDKHRAE